jgi:hypothetical protein
MSSVGIPMHDRPFNKTPAAFSDQADDHKSSLENKTLVHGDADAFEGTDDVSRSSS